MPSQETPLLKVVYEEDDFNIYFLDLGNGDLTLHLNTFGHSRLTVEQFRRINDRFLQLLILLWERGMKKVKTWVEEDNEEQLRLAEIFGFASTGDLEEITMEDGRIYRMEVMEYTIPLDEGVRD